MARQSALQAWFGLLRPGRAANSQQPAPLSPEQEAHILARAYVPEHIPALMAGVSGAQPFLLGDYLCLAKENWLIFVGYPLDGRFTVERAAGALAQARATYHPQVLWFIGPEVPADLAAGCRDRQSDVYYRLDLPAQVKSARRREVRVAAAALTVATGRAFTAEHLGLAEELIARASLPPMVAGLYRAMPDYVARAPGAVVLEARDAAGRLVAFDIATYSAGEYAFYLFNFRARACYVPGASDLLLARLIELAQAAGKRTLNLGLGISAGVRGFKEKWGATPFLPHVACAWERPVSAWEEMVLRL